MAPCLLFAAAAVRCSRHIPSLPPFIARYVQEHQILVHKLLELQDFSIYADTDAEPWVNLVGRPWDLKERFAKPFGGVFSAITMSFCTVWGCDRLTCATTPISR